MATRIQLTAEQTIQAYDEITAFVEKYNKEHDDTFASFVLLPGGNIQLTIEKIPAGSMGTEVAS